MPNYQDLVCRLRNGADRSDADRARRRSRRAHSTRLQLIGLASARLLGYNGSINALHGYIRAMNFGCIADVLTRGRAGCVFRNKKARIPSGV